MKGGFVEVFRRHLKVMVLGWEEILGCEIHVSEFKYVGCVLNESGADDANSHRKVTHGRKVAGEFKSLVNVRGLQLECERCYMRDCSCLFCCMAVRRRYAEKKRGLGLGLRRWTTLEVC